MTKFKFAVGAFAFIGLAVINFTQSESSLVSRSFASGSSGSGSSGSGSSYSSSSSSSSSSSCCSWYNLFSECNRKKKTDQNVFIDCKITTTVYESASGECQTEIIAYGVVTAAVSATFKARAHVKSCFSQGYDFHSDVVTCPTNGTCNNCTEYRPHC